MTDNRNDMPAFPASGPHAPWQQGMTLRDHFAGLALAPTIAAVFEIGASVDRPVFADTVARLCYQMADAMLAERAK